MAIDFQPIENKIDFQPFDQHDTQGNIARFQDELAQAQQESGKSTFGRFVGELTNQFPRFAASAVEAPARIFHGIQGQAPTADQNKTYSLPPILGYQPFQNFQSYQSEQQQRMVAGESPLRAGVGTGLAALGAGLSTLGAVKGFQTAPQILNKLTNPADKYLAQRFTKNIEQQTLKDVTPEYTSLTSKGKEKLNTAPSINGAPRINEGGIFKGRTVTPTPLEQEAAKELAGVPGYKPNATALEKQQLVQKEITKRGSELEKSLGNESILVPKKEITNTVVKAINNVPEKSLLLQKSDPAIQNYTRVVQNAVKQNEGTLEGTLKVKKVMDKAYENARGTLAYNSDKRAALDEVHRAGRDSLTQLMIKYAKDTPVEDSLRGQWNLYRALDQLSSKASKEAGSSIARFGQRHPFIKDVAKTTVKYALPLGIAEEGLRGYLK